MKSAILFTVSAMACLLPILSVSSQLQATWNVSNEGSPQSQGFLSTNSLASSLPFSLLQQLFTGNNFVGNVFGFFDDGETSAVNDTTPSSASENQQTAINSAADFLRFLTLAGHSDKSNWTTEHQTATKIIPPTSTVILSKTTDETLPQTTTETKSETTTETIYETTTETQLETTTVSIPETTTRTISVSSFENLSETTTETYIESTPMTATITTSRTTPTTKPTTTPTTTPTTAPTTTPTTAPTNTPTATLEKTDDRPVPGEVDVGPDGLLYFKCSQRLSLTGCRTYCHSFRNFRLAIAKTNETMGALRTHGNVMVDMSIVRNPRTGEVRFIWGDGTELDRSLTRPDLKEPVMNSGRFSSVIVMYTMGTNVLLDDAPSSYSLPCLCQGLQEPTAE